MPQMICQRDYTLRTLTGHVIHFKAGQPKEVPYECVDAALAVNIIPAAGGFADRPEEKHVGPSRIASMSPEMREAIFLHTIHELVRDGDSVCFDGGGKPKITAIRDRCGLELTATERSKLWDKYRDIIASNSELPKPKNVDLVLEVQACNTHKLLVEYYELFGGDKDEIKGWTLKEIKAAVVVAAMKYTPSVETATLDEGEGED